jgi:hypothetical protein
LLNTSSLNRTFGTLSSCPSLGRQVDRLDKECIIDFSAGCNEIQPKQVIENQSRVERLFTVLFQHSSGLIKASVKAVALEDVDWSQLAEVSDHFIAFVNVVMNLRILCKVGNRLSR